MRLRKSKAVNDYLKLCPKHIRNLMSTIREIILSTFPDIEETIKFTVPFYTRKGMLCYLSPLKKQDGIYIGFTKGYLMSDESGIFTGKNLKQIRHIELRKQSDIKKRVIKVYLEEAVMLNELKKETFLF